MSCIGQNCVILCVLRFCFLNPKLSLGKRHEMDIPLLSHELAEAVNLSNLLKSPCRAPGVDGLF